MAPEFLEGARWLLLKNPENLDLSARSTIAYQPRFNPIPLALADYLNEALRQIPVQFEWPLLVPYYFSISTCAINLPGSTLIVGAVKFLDMI